jgi:hypothetical protein
MPSLPKPLTLGKIYLILEAPGWSGWISGPILGRGGRRTGQTDGEILPIYVYHNEEERWYGLLPGSDFFRLIAPPLQSGVVRLYLIHGVWFSSHLLLEEIDRIQKFKP